MTEVVLINVEEGIALLTLNRPDRLNAWTAEMQLMYFDLLERCAGREDVGAIVVTGAGRGFCAGADMQNLHALANDDGVPTSRAFSAATKNAYRIIAVARLRRSTSFCLSASVCRWLRHGCL